MNYATHVEAEIRRAERMTAKDHRQRWVTMDGVIHEKPQPFRDKVSISWMPIVNALSVHYSPRALAHNAIGAL